MRSVLDSTYARLLTHMSCYLFATETGTETKFRIYEIFSQFTEISINVWFSLDIFFSTMLLRNYRDNCEKWSYSGSHKQFKLFFKDHIVRQDNFII